MCLSFACTIDTSLTRTFAVCPTVRALQLRDGGFPSNQTSPSLQQDESGQALYVAVPAMGLVHYVKIDYSTTPPSMALNRTFDVGGMPTSMVVAHLPTVVAK